jgi:DNA-binding winged helix-turn-helix (wHTH) protein
MIFQFGEYTLDIAQAVYGPPIAKSICSQELQVLRCLVEMPPPVTKDELIKAVWPNVIVTDESLARCISEVRQAIADSDQKIIKTVPRRGYRFSSPVSQHPENAEPAIVAAAPAHHRHQYWFRAADNRSDLHRCIAVLESKWRSATGVFQRRHYRGHHHRAVRFSELAVIAQLDVQYKDKDSMFGM